MLVAAPVCVSAVGGSAGLSVCEWSSRRSEARRSPGVSLHSSVSVRDLSCNIVAMMII